MAKTKTQRMRLSDHASGSVNMRARYDAAQTTDENRRHFAAADCLSPDVANNLGVRTILRNRCRFVFKNNPRVKGMVRTLASHTVGPQGPRLQMQLGDGTQAKKLNAKIESDFTEWAKQINLAKKLRILRIARAISGETFGILGLNPGLNHNIKLDVRMIPTDRVTNPMQHFQPRDIDGVFLDDFDNPELYRILKSSPGDLFRPFDFGQFQDFPARLVMHYFTREEEEQHRGVPDLTPAVQLFEEGRRFRAAVLAAAETAADFAIAIYTDAPADENGAQQLDPMDEIELKRRVATVLPQGWKIAQTKSEQPAQGNKEFQRELLAEAARCLEMPLSLATLDANDANMSSSYIINQPYENAIDVDRGDIENCFLNRILDVWLTLAFDPNGDPLAKRMPSEFPHSWFWPLIQNHADPSKVANADDTALSAGTTTRSRIYAKKGLDIDIEDDRAAKDYGMSVEEYRRALAARQFAAKGGAGPTDQATQPTDQPGATNADTADTEDAIA